MLLTHDDVYAEINDNSSPRLYKNAITVSLARSAKQRGTYNGRSALKLSITNKSSGSMMVHV